MSDVPSQPRNPADIQRIAEGWRRALDPDDNWAPDMVALIAEAGREFKEVFGLHLMFLPDKEIPDDEARTEFDPLRICVRQSLKADAVNNVPRLRSTLAHELGHAVLHSGMPKSRKSPGDSKVAYLTAFKRIESEAWIFARAFLMPSWKLEQVSSALQLSLRCRVSIEMAEIRFAHAPHPSRSRPGPPGLQAAIDRLRSAPESHAEDPRIREQRERTRAWERARHLEGQDPMRVRRSDDPGTGYEIHRQDYGKALSTFGWFVNDGQVLAYYGRDG